MKEQQINAIENYVGHKLPDEYKQLLLDYPDPLKTMKLDDMCPAKRELMSSSNAIIRENKFVRSKNFNTEDAYGETNPWKQEYLVIGESEGDYYAINLKQTTTAVYFWDHETAKFKKYARNLQQYVKKIFDLYCELTIDAYM